jgi:glycosyltransferase involved in cell wall biosynthesis
MRDASAFLRPRYMAYLARREALRMWSKLSRVKGKRILAVFDPSLKGPYGHHLEYARAIKEVCEPIYDVRFYANLRASMRVILSLHAQPVCEESTYPSLQGRFEDVYRRMTRFTVEGLSRIDRWDAAPQAILVMHTVSIYQLGGLVEWFQALPNSQRPNLCLQFTFPLEFGLSKVSDERTTAFAFARAAAAALVATGKTRFAANSRLLADHISKDLQQECAVLPHSLRWPNLSQNIEPDPGVVFGFFGGLRVEKGASIIARAIPEFAARYPDTKFIVHAPSAESDSSAVKSLETVPQVELIRKSFDGKNDYFKQFTRASCILVPYDPVAYAYRPSGVLIEALGLDRLIITTKDSWCWAEAERYGRKAIGMTTFASESLFSSLADARNLLRDQPIKPKRNEDVIRENCPDAFGSALIRLANS